MTRPEQTCACVIDDARECARLRDGPGYSYDIKRVCECVCHDNDDDDQAEHCRSPSSVAGTENMSEPKPIEAETRGDSCVPAPCSAGPCSDCGAIETKGYFGTELNLSPLCDLCWDKHADTMLKTYNVKLTP